MATINLPEGISIRDYAMTGLFTDCMTVSAVPSWASINHQAMLSDDESFMEMPDDYYDLVTENKELNAENRLLSSRIAELELKLGLK